MTLEKRLEYNDYKRKYYKFKKKKCNQIIYNYLKKNPWVRTYYAIRSRCENPNQPNYKWYGAAGITCDITLAEVKELWFRDEAFNLSRPSIDRINPNEGYNPQNCRYIEFNANLARPKRAA